MYAWEEMGVNENLDLFFHPLTKFGSVSTPYQKFQ